jgi:proprotein convertase subtilisin/kexin type 5
VYFNGQCLSDCPTGTFFADGSCLVCSSSCLTCSGTSTYCTSCPDGQHQYKNGCYAQCPGVIVSGRCTDRCADGQFASGGSCFPCDAKCEACSGSATNCTRCANGFMSYAGDCVVTCPTGYFPSSGVCLQCDISCNGCSGSPFICDSCAVGYVRSGNRCIEGCSQGQYIDFRSNTCDFCGEGCKVCSSPTQCSQCIDPTLVPLNGVCKKSCPPGAQLVGDTCICTFGSYFSGACISSCLDGYYSRNRVCEACQPPCRLCSGTATYCLSCISGYDLDTATNTCVRISKCKYGQYEDTTGTCRRRCINKFYYNTVCLTTCPPGFKDNGFGGCVDEPNQSICKAPQFQQGSTCVSACQVGFYPDYLSRICQKCPANCFLCNGPSLCFQCLPGYIPIHGKCEVSLGCLPRQVQFNDLCWDGCPIGTYLESNTCIRACPEKHYYYDELCYPSCPTQASRNTPDACVANCAGIPLCI